MLRRPDDWQQTYARALAAEVAEQGRQERERAAWRRTIALGIALGVLGSIAALLLG